MELAKAAGAKRAILLPVSAPFHCSLMKPAQRQLDVDLEATEFADLRCPLVNNWQAREIRTGAEAREGLFEQVAEPRSLGRDHPLPGRQGVERFIEVGAGGVLTGLLRGIDPRSRDSKFGEAEDWEKLMRRLLSVCCCLGAGCWAQTPSALESDPKGWMDIMPDRLLQGMDPAAVHDHRRPGPGVAVEGGHGNKVLICEGDKGHEFLRYDKEFADFIFHAEWRFTNIENGKGYNSGVMVRNSADGIIWHQAQTGEAAAGSCWATRRSRARRSASTCARR